MKVFGVSKDGEMLDDVAPDFGEESIASRQGTNRLKSTNPVVQKALDGQNGRWQGRNPPAALDINRSLQQELGLNPSQEMLDFYKSQKAGDRELFLKVWKVIKKTFENKSIPSELGVQQYEDVLSLKDIECENLKIKLKSELVDAGNKVSSLQEEVNNLIASIRKDVEDSKKSVNNATEYAKIEVSQNIQDVKANVTRQINEFLTTHTVTCEDLESKLKDILARATIGRLSKQFEEKRAELYKAYKKAQKFFYWSLITFAIFGCISILLAHLLVTPEQGQAYGFLAFLLNVPMGLIRLAPFYLPLFWYACHVNRLMNQNRRLMEEYAHKVVVAETYAGLAERIEDLEKKGILQTKVLSQDLLDSTIRVLCGNPNTSLDKVKAQTPVSEVVDNVVKLVRTTAELKGNQ